MVVAGLLIMVIGILAVSIATAAFLSRADESPCSVFMIVIIGLATIVAGLYVVAVGL